MFRRLAVVAILGFFVLSVASCAEEPKEDTSIQPETKKEAPPEGPFYELTKDEITSQPDWTSKNVMFKGVKIGDKTTAVQTNFGELDAGDQVGDYTRTVYEQSSYAIYTYKMTGELQKIEIFGRYSGKIADPKLKKLLAGGSEDFMREAFGPEEGVDLNPNTTGKEHIYDAKGWRFVQYDLNGVKFHSLLFSKMKK